MCLLLLNYSVFGDPILKVLGFIIAGIEAVSAIIGLVKKLFPNNKQVNDVADGILATLESMKSTLITQSEVVQAKKQEAEKRLTPNQAKALERAQAREGGTENVSQS